MRRVAVALLVGIALQGLGAIAFIAWWTREDPDRASVAPSAVQTWAAADADDAAPAEPEAAALTAEAGRATSRARVGPARESVPVTERRAQVSFRRELKVALAALQDRMAECSLPDASFTLDVESVASGIRVLDARLDTGPGADDPAVECARGILVGGTIPVSSAEPGRRWQMPFAAVRR